MKSHVGENTALARRLAAAYELSLENEVHDATPGDPAAEALLKEIFGVRAD